MPPLAAVPPVPPSSHVHAARPPSHADGAGRADSPEFMPRGVDSVLLVENLTRNINSDHLWEIFGRYGRVRSVDLARDERVGLPLGHARVTYYKTRDAEDAVSYLDGGQLDGNDLGVSFEIMPRGGGGGDRSGGGNRSRSPPHRRSRSRSREGHLQRDGGGHRSRSPPRGGRDAQRNWHERRTRPDDQAPSEGGMMRGPGGPGR